MCSSELSGLARVQGGRVHPNRQVGLCTPVWAAQPGLLGAIWPCTVGTGSPARANLDSKMASKCHLNSIRADQAPLGLHFVLQTGLQGQLGLNFGLPSGLLTQQKTLKKCCIALSLKFEVFTLCSSNGVRKTPWCSPSPPWRPFPLNLEPLGRLLESTWSLWAPLGANLEPTWSRLGPI